VRGSGYIAERTGEGMMEKMKKTVRQAARDREPLNGTDAQALEGALQQAEREIAALRVLLRECRDVQNAAAQAIQNAIFGNVLIEIDEAALREARDSLIISESKLTAALERK